MHSHDLGWTVSALVASAHDRSAQIAGERRPELWNAAIVIGKALQAISRLPSVSREELLLVRLPVSGLERIDQRATNAEAAAAVPLDWILVETDSPFLAPQRLRGRDNSPGNVVDVVEAVASARGEEVRTVLEATAANARRAFPRLR